MRILAESSAALVAALLLAAPSAAAGDAPPPDAAACGAERVRAVVAAVQQRYEGITDLRADFVQTTESVVLATGIEPGEAGSSVSRGRVRFAKPGRMRWEYREPAESLVVSDGAVLWIYEAGADQATRLPVDEGYLAGAALQFLLGEGDLAATFEIEPAGCQGDSVELDLRPREPASYERLGLTADARTGLVTETAIIDLFGNRTRIRFENVTLDERPPEGAFQFV
ncbi:MAG TPA: outer membrane lipoprotein carrier protein LolA, partial [Alphaproteobacteria bacterium]|nr:outer membrane lipoprotein carrier protein LolA [Alphaproteobacteria bacterium]